MEQNRLKILGEFEKDQAWHLAEMDTFWFIVTRPSKYVKDIVYLFEKHEEQNF